MWNSISDGLVMKTCIFKLKQRHSHIINSQYVLHINYDVIETLSVHLMLRRSPYVGKKHLYFQYLFVNANFLNVFLL